MDIFSLQKVNITEMAKEEELADNLPKGRVKSSTLTGNCSLN